MSAARSVLVRISGRVQGVGFRDWTKWQAASLGLSGWVRNLANGDVEALFTGSTDGVAKMLTACSRGPSHARVERVEQSEALEIAAGPFTIRRDR